MGTTPVGLSFRVMAGKRLPLDPVLPNWYS